MQPVRPRAHFLIKQEGQNRYVALERYKDASSLADLISDTLATFKDPAPESGKGPVSVSDEDIAESRRQFARDRRREVPTLPPPVLRLCAEVEDFELELVEDQPRAPLESSVIELPSFESRR